MINDNTKGELTTKQKKPRISAGLMLLKERQRLTLPGITQVPSALAGLTSLFGMGRGDPRRYSHLKVLGLSAFLLIPVIASLISLSCVMVFYHGLLTMDH
jgi:hypothetical protein